MAFKKCVLDLYTNISNWNEVQKEGLAFVNKKYERTTIKETRIPNMNGILNLICQKRGIRRGSSGRSSNSNLSQNPNANATNPKVLLLILTYNKASALQDFVRTDVLFHALDNTLFHNIAIFTT